MSQQKTTFSRTPAGLEPLVRQVHLPYPHPMQKYWWGNDPFRTHFATALSLVFPAGEHFVIQAVRNYRDEIKDPKLALELKRLCGQEGFHSREHDRVNRAIMENYPFLRHVEKFQDSFLKGLLKVLPKRVSLAMSAAIEHLTAGFGHDTLAHKTRLDDMHPTIKELFIWHAIEETEHKSVCFDVDEAINGSHTLRIACLLFIAPLVSVSTIAVFISLLIADRQLFNATLWRKEFRRLRKVDNDEESVFSILLTLSRTMPVFFRPGFHPWDVDDRYLLEGYEGYHPQNKFKKPEPSLKDRQKTMA